MRRKTGMTYSQTTEVVAVLGAGGAMGFAMARNIARAGLPVRAWNRSRAKAEPVVRSAPRLHRGAAEHGDEDFSATCLTSTPA
jgi:3-hydroxyisobutyrate dehydrogenase